MEQNKPTLGKVLITGIAGFIGSHTADKFLAEGWTVYGIDDLSSGKEENSPVPFIREDIRSWPFEAICADVVVHLAAQPSLSISGLFPTFDAEVNIVGTIHMLHLGKFYGAKQFIFASTSAVYHPNAKVPIRENGKIYPESNYGISKLAAEYYVLNSKMRSAVLRLGNVYGPRQVPLGENQLIPRLMSHIYQGQEFSIYGDGEQVRDYVYVTDVANAIYACAKNKLSGIYNVSTNIGLSTNEVVNIVREETEFTREIKHTETRDTRNVVLDNNKILPYWTPTVFMRKGVRLTSKDWKK